MLLSFKGSIITNLQLQMKKYKAPGADNIQAELLRYGDDVLLDELQDLYRV